MTDTVNILGTDYKVIIQTEEENPKLKVANGLCEIYSHKIVLNEIKEEPNCYENLEAYKQKVVRHEVIHAFLAESGLRNNCEYAENEELVDWIAIQLPKMVKVMSELDVLVDPQEMITLDLHAPKLIKSAKAHVDVRATEENEDEINFIQPKETVGKLISVEVLDKIRAEISEQRDNVIPCIAYPADVYADGKIDAYNRCLGIIDKYRKEQGDDRTDLPSETV